MSTIAAEIYRWTDPETGKVVTTPSLPPYPIKEKRPAGGLPSGDLVNVIIDTDAPKVKSIIEKRKAQEEEEKRIAIKKEQERAAQLEQEKQLAVEKELERLKLCESSGGKIRIGMGQKEFIACKNQYPGKINNTITAIGNKEQWIYSGTKDGLIKDKYYYFTNGTLTAIQD